MKNRDYLILITVSILFFTFISYILQLPYNATLTQFVDGDPPSYWAAAKLIYTEGFAAHPLRPFFYPFLIGLPSFLGISSTHSFWIALGLNFMCWLGTILFIFHILINYTNRKIAFIGAFIFVINTSNIINCWAVLAESLFYFLIIGSIYFLLKYITNKTNTGYFIAFVTFFCLSFITRPTYSPLLFILIPLFIFALIKKYLSLFIGFISLIIFTATIGFNAYKMRQTYGNWTLSYIGQCTIYPFFSGYAHVAAIDKSVEQTAKDWLIEFPKRAHALPRDNDSIPWNTINSIVINDLHNLLKNNKTGLAIAFVRDLASNSIASNGDVLNLIDSKQQFYFKPLIKSVFIWGRVHNILNTIAALFVIPLFFKRFSAYFWHNKRPIFWILLSNTILSISAILMSTISFTQGDRFHLIVLPMSLVSLGLIYFFKK